MKSAARRFAEAVHATNPDEFDYLTGSVPAWVESCRAASEGLRPRGPDPQGEQANAVIDVALHVFMCLQLAILMEDDAFQATARHMVRRWMADVESCPWLLKPEARISGRR